MKTLTIAEAAEICGGELVNCDDPSQLITELTSLKNLAQGKLACLHNAKYLKDVSPDAAGVCLSAPQWLGKLPSGLTFITHPKPYRAFAMLLARAYPEERTAPGISPMASVAADARVDPDATVEAFAVIESGAVIGARTRVCAHAIIGQNVRIGEDGYIGSHVSIMSAVIGDRVYIKPGARIGQPGFGFHMDEEGHLDVPQVGSVRIGHNVQIGANTCIDRGSIGDTVIGNGVRIDNLVQIAHNVEVGDNSVLVAQTGIAGSTRLGRFVIAAGQAGIAGHLNIGNGVRIAAQSGLMRDVADGETVGGSPAVPVRDWHRQTAMLQKLIRGK